MVDLIFNSTVTFICAFILDAEYKATTGREVAPKQVHLTTEQQNLLATALENTQELFDGNLGHYKQEKIHLEVEDGAVPVHSKAYSVPVKHQDAFLKELRHLEAINVLKRCGPTEWASPTFIIPKKDGQVRWISDLRELNKVLKRKVYPLPLIDEVVSRRAGYKFFTKLDLTMMYYSFELDNESKELCVPSVTREPTLSDLVGLSPVASADLAWISHVGTPELGATFGGQRTATRT
ncbi:unnamed protein product [Cylindrotheca closterium]|uniref:Reverse transcriptase domain-containing protein n=1 Tax=Cylindrotheca closterium TaxID=2856 RepID=A0AAD2G4H6_9STRA|nr:unnamed protein product [Cylindrotheca closterium]